ncbi:MAG: hypothetical protein ABI851_05980 [Saprospiraceae bacterium]
MKIHSLKIFLLYLVINGLAAQDNYSRTPEARAKMMERLESQRIAYITNKLQLSPDESIKFWPLYNEYSKKRMEYRFEKRRNEGQNNSEESLDDRFEQEEQSLKLKKSYYEKFKTAIPISKIAMLDDAEKDFKTEVIKTLKERRKDRVR